MKLLTALAHMVGSGATAAEGQERYDSTRELYAYHDGVRERAISETGYIPYAYPIGDTPANAKTVAGQLAVSGGTYVIPMVLEGHMLLQSVSFWNTDTTLSRGPVEFAIYEDRRDNANALDLITGAVGSLNAYTATAASLQTIAVTSPPVYIPAGIVWLALKNNNVTNALNVGITSGGTMGTNTQQSKTLTTSAFGSTLDMVAATWVKGTWVSAVRLNGRSFGQTSAF